VELAALEAGERREREAFRRQLLEMEEVRATAIQLGIMDVHVYLIVSLTCLFLLCVCIDSLHPGAKDGGAAGGHAAGAAHRGGGRGGGGGGESGVVVKRREK
jgi:hypothetical protein